VIQGTCEIHVEDIETKERQSLTVRGEDRMLVHMEPGKSHAFQNTGENEMILLALVNEPHDQGNPDTYTYKII
jgi:dTDP-4-dehydrorhamnose 3,5-epimerase-like enzyme